MRSTNRLPLLFASIGAVASLGLAFGGGLKSLQVAGSTLAPALELIDRAHGCQPTPVRIDSTAEPVRSRVASTSRLGGAPPGREVLAQRVQNLRRIGELFAILSDDRGLGELQRRVRAVELGRRLALVDGELPAELCASLLGLLTSVEPGLRELVGHAVGGLRGQSGLAASLVELLAQASDAETRAAALSALAGLRDERVLTALAPMLGDRRFATARVARAIAAIGGVQAADVLLAGLSDLALAPDDLREIEGLLARDGDPRVLERVAVELVNGESSLRTSALRVLACARATDHSAAIRDLLHSDPDPVVRATAIEALGRIGDRTAAQALIELGGSSDANLARRAIRALAMLRAPELLDELSGDWGELDSRQRGALLSAATHSGRPSAGMRRLAEDSLSKSDERLRIQASRTLGASGEPGHVPALLGYLRQATQPADRGAALDALERIGGAQATAGVLDFLPLLPVEARPRIRRRFERF